MNEYYILQRDENFRVVSVTPGNDPLYGNGSWNIHSGPFNSWDEAVDAFFDSKED